MNTAAIPSGPRSRLFWLGCLISLWLLQESPHSLGQTSVGDAPPPGGFIEVPDGERRPGAPPPPPPPPPPANRPARGRPAEDSETESASSPRRGPRPLARPAPPPRREVSGLRADHLVDAWSTEDGLPESSVTSMAQTPDGYLWLGTFAGLVRFDGIRFVVFDAGNTPQLASSRIVSLLVDRRGRLWIRSEFGDLAWFENGQFTRLGPEDGLPPSGGVAVFVEDQAGEVWVPAGMGILRLESEKFVIQIPPSAATKRGYQMLLATSDGQIWGTGGNILTRLWPGEIVDFVFDADRPEALVRASDANPSRVLEIKFLEASRDGGIWVAGADGLRKYRDGRWQEFRPSLGPLNAVAMLYEDRAGHVWLGTWDDGVRQFDPTGQIHRHKLTDSPAHEPVRSFFEDREGNLWIGTLGAGVFRVKPRTFRTYGIKDGLEGKIVKSVSVGPDGTAWILNSEQLSRLQEKESTRIERVNSDVSWAWCTLADRDGTVWVATLRDGLFRYRNGTWFRYPFPRSILSLFQDRRGVVWLGGDRVLAKVDGDVLRDVPLPDAMRDFQVNVMADDRLDRLYLGSYGAGIFRLSQGEWTRFAKADGLPDERVWSLYVDLEDTVWIGGYDKGLSRLQGGKIFSYSAPSIRLPGMINCILEDNQGSLWLSSNRGIHRVLKKELNDFAEGGANSINSVSFAKRDGLATSECSSGAQPAAGKGSDGRLWFATTAGVAVVDPAALSRNTVPPLVAIEEVVIDDVETGKHAGKVTVPAGRHRIEIRFTALSLTAPEKLRFRYRLEGFDPEWVDAGLRRSAFFTAVEPGDYRFQVKGTNNDGVWSESDATLAVVVLPHYWQTGWFHAAVLALASGLGVLGYHRRITKLKRERAAQEDFSRRLIVSQEQERKRIAAELHDGLGQSLLLIRNRAVLGRDNSTSPAAAEAPAQFEAISEAALQAINEVRAIAYDLRPYELDRLGLTKAMESIAQKAATTAGFRADLELDLIDDLLPPEFEINLYRIVQEAISNAVKYSQAKTLTLRVKSRESELHLVVRDDGRGFPLADGLPEPSVKGGLGLAGITERARIMGGQSHLESAPGLGTTLTVTIPLRERERN